MDGVALGGGAEGTRTWSRCCWTRAADIAATGQRGMDGVTLGGRERAQGRGRAALGQEAADVAAKDK